MAYAAHISGCLDIILGSPVTDNKANERIDMPEEQVEPHTERRQRHPADLHGPRKGGEGSHWLFNAVILDMEGG